MNERIRELAGQAGFETEHHKWIVANDNAGEGECHELLEKFADLIIRECSKVIRNGGQRKGAFGNEDLRPSEIATMIKEHFGVEE